MTEKHTYRLEMSALDLDVLDDVLRDAIAERSRRPQRTSHAENQIDALKEIRRAIFAQEPPRLATRLPRLRCVG
jgi:hypothetical protein